MLPTHHLRAYLALTLAGVLVSCGDDDDPFGPEGTVVVEGRVAEVLPASSGVGAARDPAAAPGTEADSVVVVTIGEDGAPSDVAGAAPGAEGAYRVEGVPADATDLAVVAWVGERAAGRVTILGAVAAGDTLRPAPIDYESTLEARAWAEARAAGAGGSTSPEEAALLIHSELDALEPLLLSPGEVAAVGEGLGVAGETLTAVLTQFGTGLDAEARAEAIRDAAVADAETRARGTANVDAQDAFTDEAIGALLGAGALLDEVVVSTAAAATTLDATVEARLANRAPAISEAVRWNLRARARLAGNVTAEAYQDLVTAVRDALDGTAAAVRGAPDAATIRTTLDAATAAARTAAVAVSVQVLASGASLDIQAAVAAAAETAFDTARLDARLSGVEDADAAAGAVADYLDDVRGAVEALLIAAQSTASAADLESLVALFVAGAAGPSIR